MPDYPKYKILIEGVGVSVQEIIRIQREGEPSQVVLYLWPTNKGTKILRGSFVTIFRWEPRNKALEKSYPKLREADKKVTGVWELFWDGYVDRKPAISRRESKSLILYCKQWSYRLNSMYMRAFNLSTYDPTANQDKAFMGLNLEPNGYFDTVNDQDNLQSNITRIQQKIISTKGGIGQGLIDIIKSAVNWDDLYARVNAVSNMSSRFVYAENSAINDVLEREGIAKIIAGQVTRMPASTTLMNLINQLMYQTLYTFIAIPSPKISTDAKTMNQFIYKPQLFFAVPIVSNLIFPSSIDRMEPIDTRVDQPTRVVVEKRPRVGGKDTQMILTTKEFFPKKVSDRVKNYQFNKDPSFKDKFTDEELLEERLVPGRIDMPFPDGLVHDGDGDPESSIVRIYGKYMYEIEKNASEPIQVQMKFDPYLVCGLSAAIFDEQFGYIMGRIRSIQDSIDLVNQTSKTSIEMVNIRIVPGIDNGVSKSVADDEFQIENYNALFEGNNALFDEKFKNHRIGSEFYQPIFGVGSVNDEKGAKGSIAKAMQNIYNKYVNTSDSIEQFILNIKHRPVVTEGQFMKFIGANPKGVGFLSEKFGNNGFGIFDYNREYEQQYNYLDRGFLGNVQNPDRAKPFMKERQDIILDYVKDIRNAHNAKIA